MIRLVSLKFVSYACLLAGALLAPAVFAQPAQEVTLDVFPSDCMTLVNVDARGSFLRTAIVSDGMFDARGVDYTSLSMTRLDGNGGGVEPSFGSGFSGIVADVAAPRGPDMTCSTFGADGLQDFVVFFRLEEVVEELGLRDLEARHVDVCVDGQTTSGGAFTACDRLQLVGFGTLTPPDLGGARPLPGLRR